MIKFVILVSVLLERENYLMKKKLFATILSSVESADTPATTAPCDKATVLNKIAAQNNKINSINQQQQSAQAQVDQILSLIYVTLLLHFCFEFINKSFQIEVEKSVIKINSKVNLVQFEKQLTKINQI